MPVLACGARSPAGADAATGGARSGGCHLGIVRAGGLTPKGVGAGLPCPATAARAATAAGRAATAVSPAMAARAAPRAPSGPPLTLPTSSSGPGAGEGGVSGADASASAPASGGDPLVENGLGSPLCGEVGTLTAAARRNCASSGFEAAGAPTGDYALDVHMDTGPLSVAVDAQALFQDYAIEPVWMGLVWVVHTLVVISTKVGL